MTRNICLFIWLLATLPARPAGADTGPLFTARLIHNGRVIASTTAGDDLAFCFFLKKEKEYTIEISGKAAGLVSISTSMGRPAPNYSFYKFCFAGLLKGGPAAKAEFDAGRDCFIIQER